MSFFHEASFQTYQAVKQKLETLEQQMDELSILMTQSDLRRKKLLARALAQLQSISAAVHFESATVNIPNDSEVDPMTPPTKVMGVDPMFFDTTTLGITDTLHIYHTTDYGMLEGNPCTSDTKDELITTLPSTSSMKGERVPSAPNSCSATNCGTKILSANAVLESESAPTPTPNLLQNQLKTSLMDSVCNSHFPRTKSTLSISKLLPDLLKESIEPRSAKHGMQYFISVDPTLFITWLPGDHAQPWKSFCHGHTNRRDKVVAALRTTISDRVHDPIYPSAYCVLGIIFCFIPAILISRRMLKD